VKRSGTGRSHGLEGLLACTRTKTIVVDPWTWRQVYWHAYTAEMRRGIDAFLELSHGRGLLRRIAAGLRAVRLLYFGKKR